MTTDTTTHFDDSVTFIGGMLNGQRTTGSLRQPMYLADDGGRIPASWGDDEFGYGKRGHRTPERFYRKSYTGYAFEAAFVHGSRWTLWEKASDATRHQVLQYWRTATVVLASQRRRHPHPLAARHEDRADGGTDDQPASRFAS